MGIAIETDEIKLMMNSRFLYRELLEQQIKKCIKEDNFKSSFWFELGIGWGRVAIPIIETIENSHYYGFDKNETFLNELRKRLNSLKKSEYANSNFGPHFKKNDIKEFEFPQELLKDEKNSTFTFVIASFLSHVPNGLHWLRDNFILPILRTGKNLNIILFQCEKNLVTLMAEGAVFHDWVIEAKGNPQYKCIVELFRKWNDKKEKNFQRMHSLISLKKITATDMEPIASYLEELGFDKNEDLSIEGEWWNPAEHSQKKLDFQWLRSIFSDVPYTVMSERLSGADIENLKKEISTELDKNSENFEKIFADNKNREINGFYADFWVYQFKKTDFKLDRDFSFRNIIISKDSQLSTNGGAQLRELKKNQEYLGAIFTLGESLNIDPMETMKNFGKGNFAVIPKEISKWFAHGVLTENVVLGFYSYVSPSKQKWLPECGVLFPFTSIIPYNVGIFQKYPNGAIRFSSLLFENYYNNEIEQDKPFNRVIIRVNTTTKPIEKGEDSLGKYIYIQVKNKCLLPFEPPDNLIFADVKDLVDIKKILLDDFDILKESEFGQLYLNKLELEKDKISFMCALYDLQYYTDPWKNKWKYSYYFLEYDHNKKKYISGLAIYQKEELSLMEQSLCKLLSEKLRKIIIDRETKIITHTYALRSAFSAILSRNVSHTIGSHALSYLSDTDILKKYSHKNISMLLNYIKGRMEYIADVSTLSPVWSETMDFFKDLFIPFLEQFLLVDNLNRSISIFENGKIYDMRAEKIAFLIKVKKDDNSIPKEYKFEYDTSLCLKANNQDINNFINNELEDFNVLIPHGLAGKHAFYSFLENYIRNCGKHGDEAIVELLKNSSKKLWIHIDININPNAYLADLIGVQISDNLDNFSNDKYDKINRFIEELDKEFLYNDNNIRGGGWGIYEMRISCGWLRSARTEEISSNDLTPQILKLLNPGDTGVKLKYEFYLQKPLDILMICDRKDIKADEQHGIYNVKNLAEFDSYYSDGKFRHQFVIVDIKNQNDTDWILNKNNHLKLPLKTFLLISSEAGIKKKLDNHFIKTRFVCCTCPHTNFVKNQYNLKYCLQKLFNEWLYDHNFKKKLPYLSCITWPTNKDELKIIKDKSILFFHGLPDNNAFWWKNETISKSTYFQPYSSVFPENIIGKKASQYEKNNNDTVSKEELLDVALTRILVIDERIFKKMCEKKIKSLEGISIGTLVGVNLNRVWQLMGVDVMDIKREGEELIFNVFTDEVCGNEKSEYGLLPKKLKLDELKKEQCHWTYILIHQSIIDDHIRELDSKMILEELENRCRSLIIHTGRGAIKIREGYKFIEFSNLEEHLVDNPNKYKLINKLSRLVGGKEK